MHEKIINLLFITIFSSASCNYTINQVRNLKEVVCFIPYICKVQYLFLQIAILFALYSD